MDISRKERVLARKNTRAIFSGSLEETAADIENVAMLLVSQELNIPPVCTTSELSMSRIDNGSIAITDWITYKRISWGRLPPRPPSNNDSFRSNSRRSIYNPSPFRRLVSRSIPQPVVHSVCERSTKTNDAIDV